MTWALTLVGIVAFLIIFMFVVRRSSFGESIQSYLIPLLLGLVIVALLAVTLWTSALGATLPLLIAIIVVAAVVGIFGWLVMR